MFGWLEIRFHSGRVLLPIRRRIGCCCKMCPNLRLMLALLLPTLVVTSEVSKEIDNADCIRAGECLLQEVCTNETEITHIQHMWSSSTTHRKFDCLENCAESWLEVINKCNCCITAVGKDMVVAVKKGMIFDQANKFCGITPLNQINESYIECLLEQQSSSWKYWIGDLMHYVSHGDLVPRNKTSPPPKQTGVLCSVKVYEPPDPIPENRTFFISKAKASKQDAAMACMKDGGTLSVIDTRDTFNKIEKFMKKYFGVQFWIGQINESSLGYENLKYYTDPTTSPSTNMNHCISMIQTSCQYKWMLSNCSEEIHYLCQFNTTIIRATKEMKKNFREFPLFLSTKFVLKKKYATQNHPFCPDTNLITEWEFESARILLKKENRNKAEIGKNSDGDVRSLTSLCGNKYIISEGQDNDRICKSVNASNPVVCNEPLCDYNGRIYRCSRVDNCGRNEASKEYKFVGTNEKFKSFGNHKAACGVGWELYNGTLETHNDDLLHKLKIAEGCVWSYTADHYNELCVDFFRNCTNVGYICEHNVTESLSDVVCPPSKRPPTPPEFKPLSPFAVEFVRKEYSTSKCLCSVCGSKKAVVTNAATKTGVPIKVDNVTVYLDGFNLTVQTVVFEVIQSTSAYVKRFQPPAPTSQHNLTLPNTQLVSIQIYENEKKVSKPVRFRFELTQSSISAKDFPFSLSASRITHASARCAFINQTTFLFDTTNVEGQSSGDQAPTCSSSHTTTFTLLLTVTISTIPNEVKTLSYVLETLTLICLFATLVILLCVRKKLQKDRTMVQISLTLALLLFHLFTLFSEVALLDSRACIVTTIGTHYFLLASALWMMVEGLTLFLKTTDSVLHAETTHFYKLLRYVTGWGVPVFIVGIVAVIGLKNGYYIDQTPSLLPTGSNGLPEYQKCWLSRSLTIYGAIIPVSLTILINFCVLVKVGIFIYNMSRSSEQFKPSQSDENNTSHLKAVFYAVLKLVPVLGTTWILLLVAGENVGLLYVATIMNGLQGVFLLVIYCVLGSAVRNAFMRYIKMRFMNSESELKLSTRRKTTETGVSQRVEEVTESQM